MASSIRRALLTSGSPESCPSPLAILLHDARNKLQAIFTGLRERETCSEGKRFAAIARTADTVQHETNRLFELARKGVPDLSQFEADMLELRNRFKPALGLIRDPKKGRFMVSRTILEQAVGEFDGLIERGIQYIQAQPPEDRAVYGNISEYVSTIVQNYRRLHPQISFTFHIKGGCNTSFYPASIKQALENLLNNAMQALPQVDGSIVVTLGERYYDAEKKPFAEIEDGIYVGIEIKDNGSGISEKILDQIQHFPVTTKENGSGLGLMSARNSIIKHRGHLLVESEEGQGAKITALLPSHFPPPVRF